MFKNTSGQKICLYAFTSTTSLPKTGDAANITAYVVIDGAAIATLADTSATEIDSTKAPGMYMFDVSQAESNGNMLLFTAKSTTANIVLQPVYLQTIPACFGIAGGASGGVFIAGTNDHCTVTNALIVSGTTTLSGAVSLGSTLGITGAVTLSSTLTTGAVTFYSFASTHFFNVNTLGVTAATIFGGDVTFGQGLIVDGQVNCQDVVYFQDLVHFVNGIQVRRTDASNAAIDIQGGPTAGAGIQVKGGTGGGSGISVLGGVTGGIGLEISGDSGAGDVVLDGDGRIHGTIDTITNYTGNTVQTGDSYARLGAPNGASVSADIAVLLAATAGKGPKAVTIHFTDANAANLGGVTATVLDGGGNTVASGLSDASGNLVVNLLASTTYSINGYKFNYNGTSSSRTTTAGNGPQTFATIALTIINSGITPPANPDLCVLAGYMFDTAGNPAVGVLVTATPEVKGVITSPVVTDTGGIVSFNPVQATSDVNGLVNLAVIRTDKMVNHNVSYSLVASNKQFNRSGVKLAVSTFDLNTL